MTRAKNFRFYLAGSVALITFIVYLTALRNAFVDWDDDVYVYANPYIRSLTPAFFKWAFFNFHASYWSPLTWISHALDYAVWGLNPLGHHLTNNILHAANTFLVVFLVMRLLEAWNERTTTGGSSPFVDERTMLIAAGTTGLLFGLHPLHVESAVWVAERKDLLCGLFFLLSIIGYTKYATGADKEPVNNNRAPRFFNKYYLVTIGSFILALLSKPMAVTLPIVLLILDWYPFERLRTSRAFRLALIEKLPFFALSLASSVLTVLAANRGGAMELMETMSLSARVLVGFRSLVAYLGKMLWPLNLVPYYPYPKEISPLSLEFSSAIVLVIGITVACMVMAKKQKLWLTVWGYYVVTLVPVLGIVQAGGQAMADRFTYLPSLGPFLIIGLAVAWAWKTVIALQRPGLVRVACGAATIIAFVSLSYATLKQIGIWHDSISLWSNVIEKYPNDVAYSNRGFAYYKQGRTDRAIEDYNEAIDLNPLAVKYYNYRGRAFEKAGRLDKAVEDYEKAVALDPSSYDAYIRLGTLYGKEGSFDKAIEYFNKSAAVNPAYAEAYVNRGITYTLMGRYGSALEDFNKALALNHDHAVAYISRGQLYARTGNKGLAALDFQRACELGIKEGCNALP